MKTRDRLQDGATWRFAPFLAWPVLTLLTLVTRAPLAVDETRYLTVAWEMFASGDWLVPELNGEAYSHKPPLLFWLMALGWRAWGVSEWWPRLVVLLASLASWLVLWQLARRLWREIEGIAALAVVIAGGMLAWVALSTTLMFDMLLTLWVLVAVLGLGMVPGIGRRGWLLYGLGLGLAILTKGPVALLHLLPAALLGPWWSAEARADPLQWYAGLGLGAVTGLALAGLWILPAAWLGGEAYASAMLWGQTAGRLYDSFAHARPWWWYLPSLPLLALPWVLWTPALGGLRTALVAREAGTRFCIAWALPVFVAFSAISGKQLHYLLPVLPPLALLVARGMATSYSMSYRASRAVAMLPWMVFGALLAAGPWLGQWGHSGWFEDLHPAWGGAILVVVAWAVVPDRVTLVEGAARLHVAVTLALALGAAGLLGSAAGRAYTVAPAAREVAMLQEQGYTVAYFGQYRGQLGFMGRLERPVPELWGRADIGGLARREPGAFVLLESTGSPLATAPQLPVAAFAYRSGYWSIWPVVTLDRDPSIPAQIGAATDGDAGEFTE